MPNLPDEVYVEDGEGEQEVNGVEEEGDNDARCPRLLCLEEVPVQLGSITHWVLCTVDQTLSEKE